MKKLSKKWGFKAILGLLGLIIVFFALLVVMGAKYDTSQNPSDVIVGESGDIVFSGDEVIDKSKVRRYPVTMKLGSLIEDVTSLDIVSFTESVSSGSIHEPILEISTNVAPNGKVDSIDGSGVIKTN